MNFYEIPLSTSFNQEFSSIIPINGENIVLYFFLKYNTISDCWIMDIKDSNKNNLICNISLVCGVDLLGQYQHKKLGHAFIYNLSGTGDSPNKYNLGKSFKLKWCIDDEEDS